LELDRPLRVEFRIEGMMGRHRRRRQRGKEAETSNDHVCSHGRHRLPSPFFSRVRAPLRRCTISKLSSWHAYSYICSAGSILVHGTNAVHGLVQVEGSSTVNS